jgi:hypothetical protein
MQQIKAKDVVDSVPRLGFHPLMAGLWAWVNGDLPTRFTCTPTFDFILHGSVSDRFVSFATRLVCFEAYDEDKDGKVSPDELIGCLDLLTKYVLSYSCHFM